MGIMMAGQRAAIGRFLAFSRTQESSADSAGAKYLSAAGISGKGSIEFFKKLQNQEYRLAVAETDSYDRTHPISSERIQALLQVYQKDPAWNRPPDPALEARFQRVKAKLIGFVDPEARDHQIPRERPERPGALCPRLRLSYRRLSGESAVGGQRAPQKRPARSLLSRAEGSDPAGIRQADRSHRPTARGGRPGQRSAADRGDARPRPDLDRKPEEFRRGQAGAEGSGQPRQSEPVRLVPARHHL